MRPFAVSLDKRICHLDQFSHERGESDFGRFSGCNHGLVFPCEVRVVACRDESRHIKCIPQVFTSALNEGFASPPPRLGASLVQGQPGLQPVSPLPGLFMTALIWALMRWLSGVFHGLGMGHRLRGLWRLRLICRVMVSGFIGRSSRGLRRLRVAGLSSQQSVQDGDEQGFVWTG